MPAHEQINLVHETVTRVQCDESQRAFIIMSIHTRAAISHDTRLHSSGGSPLPYIDYNNTNIQ
eukprot:3145281-Amphidinium_carterae.1